MRIPWMIVVLGFAGLVPFAAAPLWLWLAPASVPAWLDHAWLMYVALVAAFLAGSFWGFALVASMGPEGKVGLLLSTVLMAMTWASLLLDFRLALCGLTFNYIMLWVADIWRGRNLDDIPGYFQLRSLLTAGALIALIARILQL